LGQLLTRAIQYIEEIKERLIAGNKAFYANQKNASKQITVKKIQIKTVLDINYDHRNVR
jgi:hypothetical protein